MAILLFGKSCTLPAHYICSWNTKALNALFNHFLQQSGHADHTVALHLVTPARILYLNHLHRHKNKTTDTLSFRWDPSESVLGEIALCPDVAMRCLHSKRNGPSWQFDFDLRLRLLLCHAYCHLIGHDHVSRREFLEMRKKEINLLSGLKRMGSILI